VIDTRCSFKAASGERAVSTTRPKMNIINSSPRGQAQHTACGPLVGGSVVVEGVSGLGSPRVARCASQVRAKGMARRLRRLSPGRPGKGAPELG
jgi:hypothetical protein